MPEAASAPRLSLVLCARNDQFQGDSLWRLETTLNFTARRAAAIGRLDDVEILVADWGSTTPLRDVTKLGAEASRIVRFLTVPPALAAEKQRDSPFAEVYAINAAVRRARGDYVGRIDQDTLVGQRFLQWFFDTVGTSAEANIRTAAMISNRRRIPYAFAARCPSYPIVERYVDGLGAQRLPLMKGPPPDRYWECYIGIIMFHRDLWAAVEGYDESFIYYGCMEFDLFLRLRMQFAGLDLGRVVGCDFYHLDHVPTWTPWRVVKRRTNPVRTPHNPPPHMRPNGDGWGLAHYDLPLEPSPGGPLLVPADRMTWRGGDLAPFVSATVSSTAQTLWQVGRESLAARRRPRQAIDPNEPLSWLR